MKANVQVATYSQHNSAYTSNPPDHVFQNTKVQSQPHFKSAGVAELLNGLFDSEVSEYRYNVIEG